MNQKKNIPDEKHLVIREQTGESLLGYQIKE